MPLWTIDPGPRSGSDPEGKREAQVFTLQNWGESVHALDVFKPWNRIGRPPLCHVDVKIGEVVLDACLDSGATYTLLSQKLFEKVRRDCGELYPADGVNLYGASGLLFLAEVKFNSGSELFDTHIQS